MIQRLHQGTRQTTRLRQVSTEKSAHNPVPPDGNQE
jgi:hypothetical protein